MKRWSLALIALALFSAPGHAEDIPGVHKQTLRGIAYPPGFRTLMIRTTIDPHAIMPPHTHPGIEAGYVLRGTAHVMIDRHSDRIAKAGSSFIVPARTVHSVANIGRASLVILTNYVVQKGKPIIRLSHR